MSTTRRTLLALLLLGSFAGAASAATSIAAGIHIGPSGRATVDLGFFYDDLAPYGHWISRPAYGWVWVPRAVPVSWRPYEEGHWVWTEDGWFWVTDEPFGWATYHYGRWYDDPDLGWAWVPGYEWAPSWVSWQEGYDYVGWAPLPPGVSVSVGISSGGYGYGYGGYRDRYAYGLAPDDYLFVPERYFLAPRLDAYYVPEVRIGSIFRRTRNCTRYRFQGDRYDNYGLPVDRFERYAGGRLPRYRVADLAPDYRYQGTRFRADRLEVFRPRVERARVAPPLSRPIARRAVLSADRFRETYPARARWSERGRNRAFGQRAAELGRGRAFGQQRAAAARAEAAERQALRRAQKQERFQADRPARLRGAGRQERLRVAERQERLRGADRQERVRSAERQARVRGFDRQERVRGVDRNGRFRAAEKQERVRGLDRRRAAAANRAELARPGRQDRGARLRGAEPRGRRMAEQRRAPRADRQQSVRLERQRTARFDRQSAAARGRREQAWQQRSARSERQRVNAQRQERAFRQRQQAERQFQRGPARRQRAEPAWQRQAPRQRQLDRPRPQRRQAQWQQARPQRQRPQLDRQPRPQERRQAFRQRPNRGQNHPHRRGRG